MKTELTETERVVVIDGVKCAVHHEKGWNGKYVNRYTFTVPGWEECTVTGIESARRTIRGRWNTAVRNTLGIN